MSTDIRGRLQTRYNSTDKWRDAGEIECDRNYRVFAMLAGVRNGTGRAGVGTHKAITPISEPRGVPDDIELDDDGYLVSHDPYSDGVPPQHYSLGQHSFSWVTLKEVVDWPGWHKPLHMVGMLAPEEMARVKREGDTPNEWCRCTSNPTYVRYEWEVPFAEYVQTFKAWVDYLALKYSFELANRPDCVRLVFGFDS